MSQGWARGVPAHFCDQEFRAKKQGEEKTFRFSMRMSKEETFCRLLSVHRILNLTLM